MLTAMPVADVPSAQRELELEAGALEELLELLGREQGALEAQRVDEVNELVLEKGRRLEALSRHAARREARLLAGGWTPDAAGMRTWLAQQSSTPAIAAAWSRVTALADEARAKNETNGWLISIQTQRAGRQLAFLNRMAMNEPTYSASGVEEATTRQRSLGEA